MKSRSSEGQSSATPSPRPSTSSAPISVPAVRMISSRDVPAQAPHRCCLCAGEGCADSVSVQVQRTFEPIGSLTRTHCRRRTPCQALTSAHFRHLSVQPEALCTSHRETSREHFQTRVKSRKTLLLCTCCFGSVNKRAAGSTTGS